MENFAPNLVENDWKGEARELSAAEALLSLSVGTGSIISQSWRENDEAAQHVAVTAVETLAPDPTEEQAKTSVTATEGATITEAEGATLTERAGHHVTDDTELLRKGRC